MDGFVQQQQMDVKQEEREKNKTVGALIARLATITNVAFTSSIFTPNETLSNTDRRKTKVPNTELSWSVS